MEIFRSLGLLIRTMVPGRKLLILPAVIAASIGVFSCGRAEPTPASSPTPVNLRVLFERSGEVMADLNSFHFKLEHEGGGTSLPPNLVIEQAEGDVISPDKLSIDFNGTSGGFAIKSGVITLGDSSYLLNPLNGRWDKFPKEISPLGFFNPKEGIAAIMSQVKPLSLLSSDGRSHRVKGTLPAEALVSLLWTTLRGVDIPVELSIDAGDFYLLKARLEGKVTPDDSEDLVRTISLSRFNEPIVIESPEN